MGTGKIESMKMATGLRLTRKTGGALGSSEQSAHKKSKTYDAERGKTEFARITGQPVNQNKRERGETQELQQKEN